MAADVQRVLLVPATSGTPGRADRAAEPAVRRRALVLTAPGAAARDRAAAVGRPVEVCPELAPGGSDGAPGGAPGDRVHRLDALVRGHAVADRWRDVVVVADAATLQAVAAGLCDLEAPPVVRDDGGVVVVGLPRTPRPVRPLAAVVGAALVAVATLAGLGRVHPLLAPALVALAGLALLPWRPTRHAARTVLAAAGLGVVVVLVVVAGSTRFPAE